MCWLTSQAAQPELIDLAEGIWILPVVLYDVDVIGGREKTSKSRGLRVPQGRRDDACRIYISKAGRSIGSQTDHFGGGW